MNDAKFLEALNKYYKLKNTYENKLQKSKNNIKSNDSLSINQKKKRINDIKPKCIKCKRNVGTIFSIKNRELSAKCGDITSPCPLDIRINKGYIDNINNILETTQDLMNKDREAIIVTKLNFLFNFIDEQESLSEFEKNKLTLDDDKLIHTDALENIDNIVNNQEKILLIKTSTDKLNTYLKTIKDSLNIFKDTEDDNVIHDAIEIYINNVIPLLDNIRKNKYDYFNVEFDKTSEIYTLNKKNVAIASLETALEEPKIISFKI